MNKFKTVLITLLLMGMSNTQAALISTYDFRTALAQAPIAASMVATDFSASGLSVQGVSGSAFSNHYYFSGWNQTINLGRFYQASIASTGSFALDNATFSMENTGGNSQFFMRSNLDGFTSNIGTGLFSNGLVTDFDIDLSSLGTINSTVVFRWYVTASSRAGFANHQPGGAGGGSADVGIDLSFFGSSVEVSAPASIALFGFSLLALAGLRRKSK